MKKNLIKSFLTVSLVAAMTLTSVMPAMATEVTTAATESEAVVTSVSEKLTASQTKAAKVTSVKAASYNYSKIKVTWDKMDGVDGYVVYRATSKNGTYKKCYSTSDEDKNWHINTNRTSGKTYWYKVRGYRTIKGKTYYTKYSAADDAYARPNKVKVSDLYTTGDIWSYFNLTWNEVKGATGYQVYIREQGTEKYSLVDTYKDNEASFVIPDDRELYDIKVRAYRTVNGKKVYGLFSEIVNYEFDWTADMLKKAGEDYLLATYPGITLKDSYLDGTKKSPWDGYTSWSVTWPKYFCYYESWDKVKAELEAAIKHDMARYNNDLDYMCMYLDEENASPNYVHIFMIN